MPDALDGTASGLAGVSGAPTRRVVGRAPDFLIVGHQKCGTTALYEMLLQHPRIFMPAEKEPRFLVSELRPKPAPGKNVTRPTTLEEYLALFAPAGPDMLAGEASPQYLRYPEVPPAIAEIQPNAKIIALLREPADFLRSFHGQMMHGRIETEKNFQAAIELEPARRRGERLPKDCNRPHWLFYSDHVRYAKQLGWFHASFPREQVLVLIYEDYRDDNEAVVREVLRFLEADDAVPITASRTRPNKDVRLQRLHRLTTDLQEARRNPKGVSPAVRALDTAVPAAAREVLGSSWRRVIYGPRREPDPAFMTELRRRFKPEVEAVSEYLGRDLVSRWGYDRLG